MQVASIAFVVELGFEDEFGIQNVPEHKHQMFGLDILQ